MSVGSWLVGKNILTLFETLSGVSFSKGRNHAKTRVCVCVWIFFLVVCVCVHIKTYYWLLMYSCIGCEQYCSRWTETWVSHLLCIYYAFCIVLNIHGSWNVIQNWSPLVSHWVWKLCLQWVFTGAVLFKLEVRAVFCIQMAIKTPCIHWIDTEINVGV